MKKLLALAALMASSVFAGTVYQPVPAGTPCMFVPMNATQSINASFVSSVELRQSFDLEFPWGPFSLFWPKKTYYHAVYISGPTVHVEIRVKDPVEGVAIVKDTLDKIKACAK